MIKVLSKSRLVYLISKFVFLSINEKYFTLFVSLLSMYSLSIAHIFVKLTLIVTRFPDSRFTPKTVLLMMYYSVTLMFGYFVVINKLVNNFPKYQELDTLFQKTMNKYTMVKSEYIQNRRESLNKYDTNKTEEYKIRIYEIQEKTNDDSNLYELSLSNEQKKVKCIKIKLLKISDDINKIQVKKMTTSVSSLFKTSSFVMILLLLYNKVILLFCLLLLVEIVNTLSIVTFNNIMVSSICFAKEVFFTLLFLFMFFQRYYSERMNLDYYFDFFSLVYMILFLMTSYLIERGRQLPKIEGLFIGKTKNK